MKHRVAIARRGFSTAGLLLWLLTSAAFAQPSADSETAITTVTVINTTMQTRSQEVVGHGVPFGIGALHDDDLSHLLIRDARGRRVPAQFQVTERWTPDPSIRFLQVVLAADVAPRGRNVYRLLRSEEAVEPTQAPYPVEQDREELQRLFDTGTVSAVVQGTDGVQYRLARVTIEPVEEGPLRRRYIVTGQHRAKDPDAGIGRDFFWSRAVITRYPGSRQWRAEWEVCNSYPLRPLGNIAFSSIHVEIRHGFDEPSFTWKGQRFPIEEKSWVGLRYQTADEGMIYQKGERLARVPRGLFGNARIGGPKENLLAAYFWSWEIAPKAIEASRNVLKLWILPPGNYYLVDGTRAGVRFLIDRDVEGDPWPVFERYYNPLGVLVDPRYTKATRAFGDFGAFRVLGPGDPTPQPYRSNFDHDWVGFGDSVRNTHQTGSPRNRFSYLLPYYQTGDPNLLVSVLEQVWAHKQRPYHWSTPRRRFDYSDYPGDHLYEGPFHWRYDGPGATARRQLPEKIQAQQAKCTEWVNEKDPKTGETRRVEKAVTCTYGFTGYDPEHFTVDDLRDVYRCLDDPTAREYLLDSCEGLLSLNEIRGSRDAVISARVLGWVLRGLLDAYRISEDEDFWIGATRLVEKALERDGQRRTFDNGAWSGWQKMEFRGEVLKGLTNYDHFKGWMSAIGGYALYEYLDLLDARLARDLVAPFDDVASGKAFRARAHRFVLDTAELILHLSYLPGRGFIYNVDVYDDGMTDPATGQLRRSPPSLEDHLAELAGARGGWRNYNGVATWNAEFLALVAEREGLPRFAGPVREIVNARRGDRGGILSSSWYQLALEMVDER
ncbi:MAG: hypothetical protein RL885_27525 [Planctomycetota bacterium]